MKKPFRTICALLGLLLIMTSLFPAYAEEAEEVYTERTETVYVETDASGNVKDVLSSVYLKNPDGRDTLTDACSLTGIKCLTQNATPSEENGVWSFPADGEDVCFQGNADPDSLPVILTVRYEMDGTEKLPEEIAGMAGHVKVTVSYRNRSSSQQEINGKTVTLYTPFTVITMLELDDSFRHVTVHDAKLMTEAGASTILGTTFPGLAASLDTDAEDNLSESFSFEADTDSFSMESFTAVIVPNLLSSDDVKDMDDLKDFTEGVDDLNDAGEKLTKGARALWKGLIKYEDGVSDVDGGAIVLEHAADQIHDGIASVDTEGLNGAVKGAKHAVGKAVSDISDALSEISGTLDPEQLAQISGALSNLKSAAEEAGTAEAILDQIPSIDVSALKDGTAELADGIGQLQEGTRKLLSGAGELRKGAKSLYRGLRKFCNEGLDELDEQTEGLSVTAERKDALLELGEAYGSYSSENTEQGSVKFMITTDSIYVPKSDVVPEGTEGIWKDDTEPEETEPEPENAFRSVLDRFGDFFRGLAGRGQ